MYFLRRELKNRIFQMFGYFIPWIYAHTWINKVGNFFFWNFFFLENMSLWLLKRGFKIRKIIDDIKKHLTHRDQDSIKNLVNPFSIMSGIATLSNRKFLKCKNICSNDFFGRYFFNLLFDISNLLSLIIKKTPFKSIK